MPEPLLAFAAELELAFAAAAGGAPCHVPDVAFAGRGVRLIFACEHIRDIVFPSVSHLAAPGTEVELTVYLWDVALSGSRLPVPAGARSDERCHAEDARFDLHLDPMGRSSLLDRDRGLAWVWTANASATPMHERATPLRKLLQGWTAPTTSLQIVHAAAVGTAAGGALLVGRSGSGKSTSALACLAAGLRFAGDDYCLIELAGAGARAHSLDRSAKLHPDMLARLPALAPQVVHHVRDAREKAVLLVDGDRMSSALPLRAILVPRVVAGAPSETRWRPASAGDALVGLAPSTVLQLRQGGARTLAMLSALVRRLPSFWLDLGTDLGGVPRAIAALLEQLDQRHADRPSP